MKSWLNPSIIVLIMFGAMTQLFLADSTPVLLTVLLLIGTGYLFVQPLYLHQVTPIEKMSFAAVVIFASFPLIGLLITISNQLFDFAFVLRLHALLTMLLVFATNLPRETQFQHMSNWEMPHVVLFGIGICCVIGMGFIMMNIPKETIQPTEFYVQQLDNTERDRGTLRLQFGVRQWGDGENIYRVAVGNEAAIRIERIANFTLTDVDSIEQLIVIDLRDLNSQALTLFLYVNDNPEPIREITIH